jgi:hypothetical protein
MLINSTRQTKPIDLVKTWLPRLLLASAVLFLLFQYVQGLQLFYEHARQAVEFAYPIDYGEGPLLDQVRRLAAFEDIYNLDLSTPPYTITNYPPFYPLVQVPFYWLFGPALWYGRIISLIGVLSVSIFIGLTLYTLTKSRVAGVVGSLTLLMFPYVLHWAPLTRVDSLALGLSWAGLFVLVRYHSQRWGIVAGAVLLVAAIFTRQSYGLAAPAAAFIWLLNQQPKQAFRLVLWTGGLGSAIFAVLMLLSGGGFFFHIVTSNVNPFLWDTVKNYLGDIIDQLWILLAAAGIYLTSVFWKRERIWWLAAPYLVASALTALTIGKDGSNVNYLYELCAGLSLTVGALIALPGRLHWLKAALLLPLAFQIFGMVNWSQDDYYVRLLGRLRYRSDLVRMESMLQEVEGQVLTDEYMAMLPLTGHEIVYQPFEYKMLAEGDLWDPEPLIQNIQNQEYALILLYDPLYWDSRNARWTPEMLDAITQNYQRDRTIAETSIYRPK